MLNLTQIKRRISAIKSTKKVIEAMRLISISSYPKASKNHEAVTTYKQELSGIFSILANAAPSLLSKYLSNQDHRNCKILLVIVGSSKGLCGSFNGQLERHAKDRINIDPHQEYKIITVGRRANRILSGSEVLGTQAIPKNFIKSLPCLSEKNLASTASVISNTIMSSDENFSKVMALSNSFKSIFSQKPKIRTILPIEPPSLAEGQSPPDFDEIIWEQPSSQIIDQLFGQYIYTSIYSLLSESLLAETSARFVTTDGAAHNASQQIDNLSLQYNKMRQSAITREVTELSSST